MKSIFVSSTFRDMQAERDLLQMKVMPELNDFLRGYGESLDFIDLRWGINTAQLESRDGAHKILNICLKEIENCQPYIIVFLGERYGWIPDADIMEEALIREASIKEEEGIDIRHLLSNLNKSVTQLEIEYGTFLNKEQKDHCFFYFRNPLPALKMTQKSKDIYKEQTFIEDAE